MTELDTNETAATSPATAPPQTSPAKRATWPVVLGMIAMISGGLSIPMIFRDIAGTVGPAVATQAGAPGDMREINLAIRMGLAIWLVWGSFDLVRRRAAAKKSLQSWAAIKVVLLGITIIQMVAGLFGALSQASPSQSWKSSGFVAAAFLVWMSAVLPVFVLVWFSRGKIKEEVASWA